MPLYKTAEYTVNPDALQGVEEAMREHAAELRERFPTFLWWTVKSTLEPNRFLTVIVAPDEETNEAASNSTGTGRFVDALYPNVEGEVNWTDWEFVESTHAMP